MQLTRKNAGFAIATCGFLVIISQFFLILANPIADAGVPLLGILLGTITIIFGQGIYASGLSEKNQHAT